MVDFTSYLLIKLICVSSIFRLSHIAMENDTSPVSLTETSEWTLRELWLAQFVKVPISQPIMMARDLESADSWTWLCL